MEAQLFGGSPQALQAGRGAYQNVLGLLESTNTIQRDVDVCRVDDVESYSIFMAVCADVASQSSLQSSLKQQRLQTTLPCLDKYLILWASYAIKKMEETDRPGL